MYTILRPVIFFPRNQNWPTKNENTYNTLHCLHISVFPLFEGGEKQRDRVLVQVGQKILTTSALLTNYALLGKRVTVYVLLTYFNQSIKFEHIKIS